MTGYKQTFKRKSFDWNSAEKAFFRLGFDVMLLSEEFQTKPPPIFCYYTPTPVLENQVLTLYQYHTKASITLIYYHIE